MSYFREFKYVFGMLKLFPSIKLLFIVIVNHFIENYIECNNKSNVIITIFPTKCYQQYILAMLKQRVFQIKLLKSNQIKLMLITCQN